MAACPAHRRHAAGGASKADGRRRARRRDAVAAVCHQHRVAPAEQRHVPARSRAKCRREIAAALVLNVGRPPGGGRAQCGAVIAAKARVKKREICNSAPAIGWRRHRGARAAIHRPRPGNARVPASYIMVADGGEMRGSSNTPAMWHPSMPPWHPCGGEQGRDAKSGGAWRRNSDRRGSKTRAGEEAC